MPYYAPGTGYTNLQDFLGLNQGAAQQMGQRAVQGVQQAGQAAQAQLGTYQDQFQKMLASAQGQPAAPAASGGTTGGSSATSGAAGSGAVGGGAGGRGGPGGKFGGPARRSALIGEGAQSGKYGNGAITREADLFSKYSGADLSKLTADRLSGLSGWTGALSKAQQASQQAQQLGRGQAGLYSLLGDQAGPGYYGGRGRAIDAYAAANSGVDFAPVSNAWKGIADAYGMADAASAGQVDDLKAGVAGYQAAQAQQQAGSGSAPAGQQPMASPAPAGARRPLAPGMVSGPVTRTPAPMYGGGIRRRFA